MNDGEEDKSGVKDLLSVLYLAPCCFQPLPKVVENITLIYGQWTSAALGDAEYNAASLSGLAPETSQ